ESLLSCLVIGTGRQYSFTMGQNIKKTGPKLAKSPVGDSGPTGEPAAIGQFIRASYGGDS
ncbi:MAG: hypothetical protein LW699_11405, partial [Pirellula sp.]|nr:hypothetical protein [Pirellula sp.]